MDWPVFRRLLPKKQNPLTGAPAARRMKTYSAQSGYVYQYFYEGHREFHDGTEFVFLVSADRKSWHPISVLVNEVAIQSWQEAHGRELSATERYAVAKIALFQAFDERSEPSQMREAVQLRPADVDGIIETLGL